MKADLRFLSLPGQVPYPVAIERMRRLAESRAREDVPDTVFFLEHPPLITTGRGTKPGFLRRLPMDAEKANEAASPEIFECDRGGGATCHSPGQLIIYPVVKLGGPNFPRSITGYLRWLEDWVIEVLDEFGIESRSVPGATGVWTGSRKIASIGASVRRWVTAHGIALNVCNDLRLFRAIYPCGFEPRVMTRVVDVLGKEVLPSTLSPNGWRQEFEAAFIEVALRNKRGPYPRRWHVPEWPHGSINTGCSSPG